MFLAAGRAMNLHLRCPVASRGRVIRWHRCRNSPPPPPPPTKPPPPPPQVAPPPQPPAPPPEVAPAPGTAAAQNAWSAASRVVASADPSGSRGARLAPGAETRLPGVTALHQLEPMGVAGLAVEYQLLSPAASAA